MHNQHNTGEDTSWHDFDNFLQDQFMKDAPESVGTKDNFENNFENWLNQLDAEEWTRYANLHSQKMRTYGQQEIIKAANLK